MNFWFLGAGILATLTCCVHVLAGGIGVARPLLAAKGLATTPRYTAYYCWHLVTLMLAGMAAAFIWLGAGSGSRDLAVAATLCALVSALWNLAMVALFQLRWADFLQWLLFAPMAAMGVAGMWVQPWLP